MWDFFPFGETDFMWENFPCQDLLSSYAILAHAMTETRRPPSSPPPGLHVAPALLAALKRLLRPLVRFLIARGMSYPQLCALLKTLYVEVANDDFALPGKRQTDSRLSLLTGVHRKDVKRLTEAPGDDNAPPENVSLGARLIARWCAGPDYLNPQGLPRPLPRSSEDARQASFDRLVEEESKDIRARAVLDEWLRLGLVRINSADQVELITAAFVPQAGLDEKAWYFGRNLRDHIAAATHNLQENGPPFLERCVYSDQLSSAAIDELGRLARERSMETLLELNRRAAELRDVSLKAGDTGQRMSFGVYFFSERSTNKGDDGKA